MSNIFLIAVTCCFVKKKERKKENKMRQEVPENWLLGAPRKNIQKLARSGSKRQKKNKEKKVGDPIVSCET